MTDTQAILTITGCSVFSIALIVWWLRKDIEVFGRDTWLGSLVSDVFDSFSDLWV